MLSRSHKKGFTIIEVIIVLAIAGLIFAIVFWALPNLQKNQRDNARRNIVGNLVANLDQAAANQNGRYPTTAGEFATYIQTFYECDVAPTSGSALDESCDLIDPQTDFIWSWVDQTASGTASIITASDPIGTLITIRNGKCSDTTLGGVEGAQGARAYAIMARLENGIAYCADNN